MFKPHRSVPKIAKGATAACHVAPATDMAVCPNESSSDRVGPCGCERRSGSVGGDHGDVNCMEDVCSEGADGWSGLRVI